MPTPGAGSRIVPDDPAMRPTSPPGSVGRIAPDDPATRRAPPPGIRRRSAPDENPTPVVVRHLFNQAVGFAIEPLGDFVGFLEDGVCRGVFSGPSAGGTFRAVRSSDGRYHAQGEYTRGRRGTFEGDWKFIDEIPDRPSPDSPPGSRPPAPPPAEHPVWPPGPSPDPRRVPPQDPSFDHPIWPPDRVDDGPMPGPADHLDLDRPPEPTREEPPAYPEKARASGIQGTVEVQALVDRNGVVRQTRITRSIPGLDDAALEAVRQWRFRPATSHDKPIACWVVVPVRFNLH
jgi:protein TonB